MLLYHKEGVSKVLIVTDDTPSLNLSHYILWFLPVFYGFFQFAKSTGVSLCH